MQCIKNLRLEDSRREDYIKVDGYKAHWLNGFCMLEDNKIVSYTGIEYHKKKGLKEVKIKAYKDYYEVCFYEFKRYDISKLGMLRFYIKGRNLDKLSEYGRMWLEGKLRDYRHEQIIDLRIKKVAKKKKI